MEKIHPNGVATYTADGAIARGEVVKFNSGKVKKCEASSDIAMGVALDAATDGEDVPVAILGAVCGTVEVLATGSITQGQEVGPTGAAATSISIGFCVRAAASGEYAEVATFVARAMTSV